MAVSLFRGAEYCACAAESSPSDGIPDAESNERLSIVSSKTMPKCKPGSFVSSSAAKLGEAILAVEDMLQRKSLHGIYAPREIQIWAACMLIPTGSVASYSTLSRIVQGYAGEQIDTARYSRYVGRAMSRNPLSPHVPCHRVVGSDGALVGYSYPGTDHPKRGTAIKSGMLMAEGVVTVMRSDGLYIKERRRIL